MSLLSPGHVSIHEVLWVGIELGLATYHSGPKFVRKLGHIVDDDVLFFLDIDAPTKDKKDEKLLGSPPIDRIYLGDLEQASIAIRAIMLQERGVRKHTREEMLLSVFHVDLR
jgi:hypothetical protein